MYKKSHFVWGIPLKEKHIILVEGSEIPNNHQEFIKPCKSWDTLPTSTGEFTGFLNHQQFRGRLPSLKPTVRTWKWAETQRETIVFQPSIFRGYVSFRECRSVCCGDVSYQGNTPPHSRNIPRQAREALARLEKAQVMASNLRSEGGEDLVVVVVVVVVVAFMYSMVVSGSLTRW